MLNLDTHILIHALLGKLRPKEERLLKDQTWSISAIVLWELTKLVQLGRIQMDLNSPHFQRVLAQLHVWPLDWEVCQAFSQLDFKSDPADEIIAATSLVHQIPLVTRDKLIRRSKRIPLA